MPQIRSERNTVTAAKTARKRPLQSLMEMFLSTSLHERNVRPWNSSLGGIENQVTRPQSVNKSKQPFELYLSKEIAKEGLQEQEHHSQVTTRQKLGATDLFSSCHLGGQGAEPAKAGSTLCFQTLQTPWLNLHVLFLSWRELWTIWCSRWKLQEVHGNCILKAVR